MGQRGTCLVDRQKVYSIDQFWGINSGFCEQMALTGHPLDWLLELEGTRGSAILYLGYVEVSLQIPGIRGYKKDILLLVILTMTYSEKVLVMVGSKIIDRVMGMITNGELVRANVTWKQTHSGAIMSGSLQLPCKGTKGDWGAERGGYSLCSP